MNPSGSSRATSRHPPAGVAPAVAVRHEGLDLFRLRPVGVLIRWAGFPYVFQALLLAAFVALAAAAWGGFTPPGIQPKLFARANLVTLLVWGIWWTAMIWIAVLFGRVWCAVCPLELVGNAAGRLARTLRLPQRPLPRWIASGALIAGLYAGVQLLVAGAQIHRVPAYTSFFLTALLVVAWVTGMVFKDRAFCRGFCPVGLLLGTYGRGGMLAVRRGDSLTCRECATRECLSQASRERLDARSCPSLLQPPQLASNRDCLVCGQCLKTCNSGNLRLLLRRPFAASDARERIASWPVTAFILIVSGFVIWELFTEWPAALRVFLAPPGWMAAWLDLPAATGWFNGIWALVIVPLIVWSALAVLARGLGAREAMGVLWRRLALPLVVVVAAGHMAKGLAKFVSWAPFLPEALRDPVGAATAGAIAARLAPSPAPLVTLSTVAGAGLALVAVAAVLALREQRLANPGGRLGLALQLPIVVLAVGFAGIIAGWIV
jgi:polyferredoxin